MSLEDLQKIIDKDDLLITGKSDNNNLVDKNNILIKIFLKQLSYILKNSNNFNFDINAINKLNKNIEDNSKFIHFAS